MGTEKKLQQSGVVYRLDWLKWTIIVALLVAGVVFNSYYDATIAYGIRAAGWIVLAVVLLGIAYFTKQGQKAWEFIKGARTELRKVVWPTRKETVQMSIIVIVMIIITALVLWGFDTFFMWLVSWLTGQRG